MSYPNVLRAAMRHFRLIPLLGAPETTSPRRPVELLPVLLEDLGCTEQPHETVARITLLP